MGINFAQWLLLGMKDRGWNQAEMSRRSKLTRQALSNYLDGRIPNEEALEKIAAAFELPKNIVLRAAGIMEYDEDIDDEIEMIMHEVKKLHKDDQAELLAYIRMKNNLRKKK
jgi:transcriptional regulator with XRE-family HTH domain